MRNTLSQIPSVFGQLVYLASTRNEQTGRYEHHGLELDYGDKETHNALRKLHVRIFENWLGLGLPDQKTDLELHFSGAQNGKRAGIANWLQHTPYRRLVPSSVPGPAKKHFISNLDVILQLFNNQFGVTGDNPAA